MQVLAVILNYRTQELSIDCLASLEPEVADVDGLRVVVVDNCSGDGSVEAISRAIDENNWQSWVEMMPLEENNGFAAGNNAAIRSAMQQESPPDYILLLNSDMILPFHLIP